MTFERLTTNVLEAYEKSKVFLTENVSDFSFVKDFIAENKLGLILGIGVATLVFVIKNTKFGKDVGEKKQILDNINNIMANTGMDFDEAKEHLIVHELRENMDMDEKAWHYTAKDFLYSGQKVTFKDREIGNVTGYFIGLVKPELYGYDPIYILRLKDGTMRKAPVSFVEVDTIYVHERKKK